MRSSRRRSAAAARPRCVVKRGRTAEAGACADRLRSADESEERKGATRSESAIRPRRGASPDALGESVSHGACHLGDSLALCGSRHAQAGGALAPRRFCAVSRGRRKDCARPEGQRLNLGSDYSSAHTAWHSKAVTMRRCPRSTTCGAHSEPDRRPHRSLRGTGTMPQSTPTACSAKRAPRGEEDR